MAKQKSAHAYELELRRMIKEMTKQDCQVWLGPLIKTTAYNMVVRDKIQDEILEMDSLITPMPGSMGQIKNEVSPLLPHYDKCQRTITQQLTALGLTFEATPSKVKDDRAKGVDETDSMAAFYTAARK